MKAGWRRHGHRVPLLGWLILVWLLLWGELSVLVAAGGVVVAVLAIVVARLPLVPVVSRLRPRAFATAVAVFVWDLVSSAVLLGWHAVRHGRHTSTALIAVPVQEESDVLFVLTSNIVSLTPGSVTVEIDRPRGMLFVHVLPAADRQGIERQRRRVLQTEGRLVRAVGSPRDLQALRERDRADERPTANPDREEG